MRGSVNMRPLASTLAYISVLYFSVMVRFFPPVRRPAFSVYSFVFFTDRETLEWNYGIVDSVNESI